MTAYNPSIRHASVVLRIARTIAESARRVAGELTSAYRRHTLMRELEALDNHLLRDIGLHRSEIGSVVAELTDAVPATRRQAMAASTSGRAPT